MRQEPCGRFCSTPNTRKHTARDVIGIHGVEGGSANESINLTQLNGVEEGTSAPELQNLIKTMAWETQASETL